MNLSDYFPAYSQAVASLDPELIRTDAPKFQFKADGDANGVTLHLKSVKAWEPAFSGLTYVWKAKDGKLYIADGHQRLGLALRLKTDKQGNKIFLNAQIFLEEEGWTVEKMRAFAAARNIAEGGVSTKALDVAKLLRNGGPKEFLEGHIPVTSVCYKQGKALAALCDHAFNTILNNQSVKEIWGVVVGERVKDPEEQMALLRYLIETKPSSESLQDVVAEAIHAGFEDHRQTDLLDDIVIKHALIKERIDVFKRAQHEITKRQKLIQSMIKRPDELARCGIDVATEPVFELYQLRVTMGDRINDARCTSELSRKLTEAARLYFKTRRLDQATEFFMKELEAYCRPYIASARKQREHLEALARKIEDGSTPSPEEPPVEAMLPMGLITGGRDTSQPSLL